VHIKQIIFGLSYILFLSLTKQALAAPIEDVDPSRIGDAFKKTVEPEMKPEDLPAKGDIKKASQEGREGKSTELLDFKFSGVVIEGLTVFKPGDFKQYYANKIGKKVSLADLHGIAAAMTEYCRNKGYILTRVLLPAQEIDKGIVKLQVIEGFIDKFTIEGEEIPGGSKFLEAYAQKIINTKPLNVKALERYVLLANDLPGLEVKTVISPSPETFGAANIVILVHKHKRVDASAGIDNQVSRRNGPTVYTLSTAANETSMGGRTGILTRQSTAKKRLEIYSLSHVQNVGTEGTKVMLSVNHVRSTPYFTGNEEEFSIQGINTRGDSVAVNVSYPVIRSRSKNFNLYAGLDASKSNTLHKEELSALLDRKDKIVALRLGSSYEFVDKYWGANIFSGEFSKGLNFLDVTKDDSAPVKRTRNGARSNFTKIKFSAVRLQYLPKYFSILFGLSGQHSLHQLLSGEEFGFGGHDYGKAFDNSTIVGDHGLAAKVEFRYDANPSFLDKMQLFTFYDVGKTRSINENRNNEKAASGGFGARLILNKHFSAALQVARPLEHEGNRGNKRKRFFFSVGAHL
jgi:hemolysin activation/secretion protein